MNINMNAAVTSYKLLRCRYSAAMVVVGTTADNETTIRQKKWAGLSRNVASQLAALKSLYSANSRRQNLRDFICRATNEVAFGCEQPPNRSSCIYFYSHSDRSVARNGAGVDVGQKETPRAE